MSATLIIFLLIIAATSLAIHFSKRLLPERSRTKYNLNAPPPVSLFDGNESPSAAIDSEREEGEKQRAETLARAAQGDAQALREAHRTKDRNLYDAALDLLVAHCANDREALRRLAAEIAGSDYLRANRRVAEMLIEDWKNFPDKHSTAEVLHVAARADDAAVYKEAVDVVLQHWRANTSGQASAEGFCELIESQFWVIGAKARASGAGFVLKEKLAEIRRELTAGK